MRAFSQHPSQSSRILPPDSVPVDTTLEPNKVVIPDCVSTLVTPSPPIFPPTTWPNYVSALPTWEATLIGNVTILDKTTLLQQLRDAPQMYFASDGGAVTNHASFGCVLASGQQILVECGGHVDGADPQSFRAEAYGLLAILRIIHHLRKFYCTGNRTLNLKGYTNSNSLLLRLQASRRLQHIIPRRTLFSEADVELEILSSLQLFPQYPNLHYVEGHQDSKYPNRPLSWPAKLNQRCDQIATEYLAKATTVKYTTPFFSLQPSQPQSGIDDDHPPSSISAPHFFKYSGTKTISLQTPQLGVSSLRSGGLATVAWVGPTTILPQATICDQMGQRPPSVPIPTVQLWIQPFGFMPFIVRMRLRRLDPLPWLFTPTSATSLARVYHYPHSNV